MQGSALCAEVFMVPLPLFMRAGGTDWDPPSWESDYMWQNDRCQQNHGVWYPQLFAAAAAQPETQKSPFSTS